MYCNFIPNNANEVYNDRYFHKLDLMNRHTEFKKNLQNFIQKTI